MAVSVAQTLAVLRARAAREREVWLFGSFATGEAHVASDVDHAVVGMDPARYDDAVGDLFRLFPCPVDLVDLGRAEPSLREAVFEHGRRLGTTS